MPPAIALIGGYSADVVAHRAIPRALELARSEAGAGVEWRWTNTREIRAVPRDLDPFAGFWVVPGSPYENPDGALAAIRSLILGNRTAVHRKGLV